MGRELRRKQAKKERKNLQKEDIVEQNQIKKLIKIVLLLLLMCGLIYLISALFVTKELNWFSNKETTPTSTVTNSILASSIFKQSEEEYYVYFYDFTNEDTNISSTISSKLSSKKVYKVNTASAMNNNYVSETTNKNAKKLEELKVKANTLIKISSEIITEYYEDEEINRIK